jgi:hypothetical protein
MRGPSVRLCATAGAGSRRALSFERRACHRPCSRLPPNELVAYDVVLCGNSDGGAHGYDLGRVLPDLADDVARVVASIQQDSCAVEQRLPCRAADQLAGVVKVCIEAIVLAFAGPLGRRNDDCDVGHGDFTGLNG